MPTDCLFREDAYLKDCEATVLAITEQGGIVLDRTVFYATSGGQPGDSGRLTLPDGTPVTIASAVYTDPQKTEIAHVPAEPAAAVRVGDVLRAEVDWEPRYGRMKIHTALHLLSVVLPYPITGASVGNADGRADFDIPDAGLDKEAIAAKIAEMIATDAAVSSRWISDADLEANPGLVKSMSVRPPMGTGRVRLIDIEGLDLQPCGGTHVRRIGEIGSVAVTGIEKKGKQNRRVRIALV